MGDCFRLRGHALAVSTSSLLIGGGHVSMPELHVVSVDGSMP